MNDTKDPDMEAVMVRFKAEMAQLQSEIGKLRNMLYTLAAYTGNFPDICKIQ